MTSGSGALSLTLPEATSRSRRRRLPRPPKFTRWQKFWIGFCAVATALQIASGLVMTPRGLIVTATSLAIIRVEFTCGVRGDGWRRTIEYQRWNRAIMYGAGAYIAALVLHTFAGLG